MNLDRHDMDEQDIDAMLAELEALDLATQRSRITALCKSEEENYSENRSRLYLGLLSHADAEIRRPVVEALWYYPDEAHLDRILWPCASNVPYSKPPATRARA